MEHFTITTILLLCAAGLCASLRIGAFNVRIFGQTKFSNSDVVSILVQVHGVLFHGGPEYGLIVLYCGVITRGRALFSLLQQLSIRIVQRYDLILLQEIRDSSETVIHSFLRELNNVTADDPVYNVDVSQRLGRTSSKEQYAFLYREDTVEIIETLQFNDTVEDIFEREPYTVYVRAKLEDLPNFFLVGIHVRPDDAFVEIDALSKVYDEAVNYFETESGMILGDFNADCIYLSMANYYSLSLVTDTRFTWTLRPTDTTTTSTICAYDRIVVAGEIGDLIRDGSARVFRFDEEYELTEDQTLAVSDHYPVEIELQSQVVSSPFPSSPYSAVILKQGQAVCSSEEQLIQATTAINQQVKEVIQNLTAANS